MIKINFKLVSVNLVLAVLWYVLIYKLGNSFTTP
jgi:hypothetical protein